MRSRQKQRHRPKSRVLPVLISLVLIVGVAYGAALVWQNTQDSLLKEETVAASELTSPSLSEQLEELPVAADPGPVTPKGAALETSTDEPSEDASADETSEESSSKDEESDVDEPIDSSEESPLAASRRERFPYAMAETPLAPASYFDDAIFFGDSISTGIPLYNMAPSASVVAYTGISTVNVLNNACIDTDQGFLTMLDAAKARGEKKKVYIMLGGNGLGYDEETFIRGYGEFVDAVKEQYPDALVYIQSMTPVTDYAYKTYPSVSNELIEEYNVAIHNMAKAKGVLYLDVASALMDEHGKLPDAASPVDGMHFTPEYYAKWFAYLRSHAVQEAK